MPKPSREKLEATVRTDRTHSAYVSVRPVGPSMNAGLAPHDSARSRRNGVKATSGMLSGGSGARKIMTGGGDYTQLTETTGDRDSDGPQRRRGTEK